MCVECWRSARCVLGVGGLLGVCCVVCWIHGGLLGVCSVMCWRSTRCV